MRSRLLAAVTLLLVVAAVVAAVIVWRVAGDDPSRTPAAAGPASLDELAAADPVVARAAFCRDVPAARVGAALGGAPEDSEAYDNGDTVTLGAPEATGAAAVTDVAHEYGCSWTGADGAVVRAWVFAPPVTAVRAKRLARLAEGDAGCTPYDGGPGFGEPSAAYSCAGADQTVAGRAGLFGDAWLACTVAVPGAAADTAALRERADRWCVDVAIAAR